MLLNQLRITLRILRRYKGFTSINVAGLAAGLAACFLILLYVEDELSYDRYHEHAADVYRVTEEQLNEDGATNVHRAMIDPPVAPLIQEAFPEVLYAARLTPVGPLLSNGDRHVESGHCYWADPEVLDIFGFTFLAGSPASALDEPFTLLLSASKARALFGGEAAVGRVVLVNNEDPFTVTGVFADVPRRTHLPIDVLGSMATLGRWFGGPAGWDSPNYVTYLRLAEGATAEGLERKLPGFLAQQRGEEHARTHRLHLQRLTDIHLRSHLAMEMAPNGDITYVYLLSAIALFILVIACINFTNLTTARSTQRAREVGLRKAVGARRVELIRQFLVESTLLSMVSVLFAVVVVELALPFFNGFTGKGLSFWREYGVLHAALLAGIGLVVGVAAGSYPAFYLSAFTPSAVLKGGHGGSRRSKLRASLVVVQFGIAMVLMVATAVVYRQLAYVQSRQQGFDEEQVLILPGIRSIAADFEPFREQLSRHPDVLSVAQSNPVPSSRLIGSYEASTQHEGQSQLSRAMLFNVWADARFFSTYGVPFLAGGTFTDGYAGEADTEFVLNETAARRLGWDDPAQAVDQPMRFGGWQGRVVGVVQDFHLESLHQEIAPMVFYMEPRNYRLVSIKVRAGADMAGLIGFLEAQWQRYEPNYPLDYEFLDERFGRVYEAERKLGKVFAAFAILALVITCLGLFGLAAFTIEQRTKEIGVRKVLGASVLRLVGMLTGEVGGLVLIAFCVAAPLAYLAMARWLDGFAYHMALPWWIFAGAGLGALAVALLTVSYLAVRAALGNPVQALRYE